MFKNLKPIPGEAKAAKSPEKPHGPVLPPKGPRVIHMPAYVEPEPVPDTHELISQIR